MPASRSPGFGPRVTVDLLAAPRFLPAAEARAFAVAAARWPPLCMAWVRGPRPFEAAFLQAHGAAAFAPHAEHRSGLCPILQLALRRAEILGVELEDGMVEMVRWDVVRHLRRILGDSTFLPRDLCAALYENPRALARLVLRETTKE